MKSIAKVVIVLLSILAVGYFVYSERNSMIKADERKMKDEIIVKNVKRVFMHDPGRYSVLVQDPGSLEYKPLNVPGWGSASNCHSIRIFGDVPESDSIWLRFHYIGEAGDLQRELEIHIRSEKDIEGGGWDHGKHGRGQTNILQ